MKLFGREKINEFKRKHPLSRKAIDAWIKVTKSARWTNIEDIRSDFKTVDYISSKGVYCFDIKGNNYRIVVTVTFVKGAVFVNEIFTHSEYDKWNQKK